MRILGRYLLQYIYRYNQANQMYQSNEGQLQNITTTAVNIKTNIFLFKVKRSIILWYLKTDHSKLFNVRLPIKLYNYRLNKLLIKYLFIAC